MGQPENGPSRGLRARVQALLRQAYQGCSLPRGETELPLRAEEDLPAGAQDQAQEGQGLLLHGGLQAGPAGDLRPVRDQDLGAGLPREERLTCKYTPRTECKVEAKKYCYKAEVTEMVEVCDAKIATSYR